MLHLHHTACYIIYKPSYYKPFLYLKNNSRAFFYHPTNLTACCAASLVQKVTKA